MTNTVPRFMLLELLDLTGTYWLTHFKSFGPHDTIRYYRCWFSYFINMVSEGHKVENHTHYWQDTYLVILIFTRSKFKKQPNLLANYCQKGWLNIGFDRNKIITFGDKDWNSPVFRWAMLKDSVWQVAHSLMQGVCSGAGAVSTRWD